MSPGIQPLIRAFPGRHFSIKNSFTRKVSSIFRAPLIIVLINGTEWDGDVSTCPDARLLGR
jgi:hypothetical protein